MKAPVIGILLLALLIFVAKTVSQTTSTAVCVTVARQEFGTRNAECAMQLSNLPGTESTHEIFCKSSCVTEVNSFFMWACMVPLGEIFCTKRTNNETINDYCVTEDNIYDVAKTIGTIVGNGPCFNRTCGGSDVCNNTVQNLSCCVNEVTEYTMKIDNDIDINYLPNDCMVPQCPGGALGLLSMPIVITATILVVLMAVA